MKVELIGHDEKYALEQSLLTLFPGEKPVYGTVDETADAHWVRGRSPKRTSACR